MSTDHEKAARHYVHLGRSGGGFYVSFSDMVPGDIGDLRTNLLRMASDSASALPMTINDDSFDGASPVAIAETIDLTLGLVRAIDAELQSRDGESAKRAIERGGA